MLEQQQADAIEAMAQRLASDPDSDPRTGAELGAGAPVPQDGAAGKPDRV